MANLSVGDRFPDNIVFKYVPWTTEDATVCGQPVDYKASEEWKNKTVVLVSVPGAFTPGCQGRHIPPYIEKLPQLRAKAVDIVAVIAFNDAYVMSAWGKVNRVKNDDILFMADTETKFANKVGWMRGERNARFAMLIDKQGTIKYMGKDDQPGQVEASSVEAILECL